MLTWRKPKYKKGIDIVAVKKDLGYKFKYEVYLYNEYLGRKKVLVIGDECMELLDMENEDDLEGFVLADIQHYLDLFFSDRAEEYIMPQPGAYLRIPYSDKEKGKGVKICLK